MDGKTGSKREIRKQVLALRDGLSPEQREKGTLLMTERILGHQWFYSCEYFLCFVSFGSEIGTGDLIAEALRMGKQVFVPKIMENEKVKTMEFYRISSLEELQKGYFGVMEPSEESEKYIYSPERAAKTFLLMPGVAFDPYRNRLGYGKGFYDRYLSEREALQIRTVAVGYQCQMVQELPAEETDIKPYQVICV